MGNIIDRGRPRIRFGHNNKWQMRSMSLSVIISLNIIVFFMIISLRLCILGRIERPRMNSSLLDRSIFRPVITIMYGSES